MILDILINNLKIFQDDFIRETFQLAISRKKVDIINFIRERLYREGKGGDDESLGEYTPYTIEIKQMKNQPTDRVTLRDTGAFYDSLDCIVDSNGLEIFATDPKTQTLIMRWGEQILALTDDEVDLIKDEIILPALIDAARKLTVKDETSF